MFIAFLLILLFVSCFVSCVLKHISKALKANFITMPELAVVDIYIHVESVLHHPKAP